MKTATAVSLALAAVGCALAGCSTPEPVKATAAQTSWMMGQLQQDLLEFETNVAAGSAIVLASQHDLAVNTAANKNLVTQSLRTEELADNALTIQAFNAIKAQTAFIRTEEADLAAEIARIDARHAALFKALPDVKATFSSAANATNVLGQDLPTKTVLEETAAVMQAVWKNTQANRDKLDKATSTK